MRIRRFQLSVVVGLVLFAGAGSHANEPAPADDRCADCNVVFISIDTLRADHLGCYGYWRPTSPNVDRFSKDAVLFRTAIAHAPSTEPSHASMFTSLIPAHHGARRAKGAPISAAVTTMAEILGGAGFRTVSFNGGGQVSASYGFDRGFELYESSTGPFAEKVDRARDWIRQIPDGKFFLFLHTYQVHAPYAPEKRFLDLFDEGYAGELAERTDPGVLLRINDGRLPIDAADRQHIVNTYDAEVRSMDEAFGRLIAFLEQDSLLEKTIVLFTSDHGEEFGEHHQIGRHSHTLYDELLHVPLIIRFPNKRYRSSRVERQVRGIDLLPTILDAVGLEPLATFEGRSLMELIAKGSDDVDRVAVSQLDSTHAIPPTSIRTAAEKLIVGADELVAEPLHRWFAGRATLEATDRELLIPIESFHEPRTIRILVDGQRPKTQLIFPHRQTIRVAFRTPGTHAVHVEAMTPCQPTDEVSPDPDVPCVSFRIFNRHEYFRLDDDPGEQDNRFADPRYSKNVAALNRRLDHALSGRSGAPEAEPVEVDEATRERLKALGYVDD